MLDLSAPGVRHAHYCASAGCGHLPACLLPAAAWSWQTFANLLPHVCLQTALMPCWTAASRTLQQVQSHPCRLPQPWGLSFSMPAYSRLSLRQPA